MPNSNAMSRIQKDGGCHTHYESNMRPGRWPSEVLFQAPLKGPGIVIKLHCLIATY